MAMKGAWHLDSLTSALSAATKTAAEAAVKVSKVVAKEVVHGVVGAECLLPYALEEQPCATCGPAWSIYLARSKKEGAPQPLVSAWVLDKRALAAAGAGRRLDALVEQCRREVQALTRLKHPAVLRLVAPLEETRTQLVFLTEPVEASLGDVLHGGPAQAIALSPLEVKHGLLQVADGLSFLHHDAGLVHRGVSPASIVLTRSGAWKLAGFGFAVTMAAEKHPGFDYSDQDDSPLASALHPPLAYLAPELVATGRAAPALPAADVFSLALVAAELAAAPRRPMLPPHCSLIDYESRVRALASSPQLATLPADLAPILRAMLAPAPEARPPAASFAACAWLTGDIALRALKFLDTLLQKSIEQRAAFYQDLPGMAAGFDRRVLLRRVLPPLLGELRTEELQATVMPIVMTILKVQSPQDFNDVTLPALRPLLDSATGPALLQLTQAVPLFLQAAGGKGKAGEVAVKLLVRALASEEPRCQEEALRQVAAAADALDYEALKAAVLPAVHAACLATTSAAVRVAAFRTLAAAAGRCDVGEAERMLATAATCVAVDKSAPTAMCVLGLGDALAKKWGPRLAAERVLPAIAPLLVAPSLSSAQFATACKTVRDIVALVEKARGSGEAGPKPAAPPAAPQQQAPLDLDALAGWDAPPAAAPAPELSQPQSMHLKFPGKSQSPPGRGPAGRAPPAAPAPSSGGDWLAQGLGHGPNKPAFEPAKPARPVAAPAAAADPFAWPAPVAPAVPAPSAPKIAPSDPLAGLWTSAAPHLKYAPANGTAALDPFDDLALQHSGAPKPGGVGNPQPPSLI